MAKKIYVGNLNYATTEDQLSQLFAQYGTVVSAAVISDRYTGRSRGFGFVEMSDGTEAQAAIKGLNEKELNGRGIKVNEARPPKDRNAGGGGYQRY